MIQILLLLLLLLLTGERSAVQRRGEGADPAGDPDHDILQSYVPSGEGGRGRLSLRLRAVSYRVDSPCSTGLSRILQESLEILGNPWKFLEILENPGKSLKILENPWKSLKILENPR